ncbi:hypothetical protein CJ030_MR2G004941 [Morella rubra]|uniref:GST N-terminal domain-containing protein n=1 Tax=Morella rubra TaxID=262757 RepID=A0A6A1WFB4_9ROSI|nr:hypothetical protein CJ030_MR2G004941 [Morella rubra]
MATALNLLQTPILRTFPFRRTPKSTVSVRATSSSSETPITSTSVSTKEEQTQGLSSSVTFAPPPDFKPPEPKRFGVRPDKTWDVLGASLALFFRLGTGVFVSGYSASFIPKNEYPPGQYALDFSDSKAFVFFLSFSESEILYHPSDVREIVAVLDLDVLFYPCPRNSPNFRPKVAQMGGKQQFPYMVDPNTGVSMYESDDIIKYLVGKYGDGSVPFMLSLGLLTTLTAGFALIGRMGRGSSYAPSKMPPKPLEIWAYEGSPFCKLVREVLVELELPHLVRSCARGSPKRQILYERVGHFQVPYLEDPNTGVQMFESAEIIEYIRATYALP